jgi:hypothetical protein
MSNHPKVEEAPGIVWRPRASGWEARWQCRSDIAAKGFSPKSMKLWAGTEPSAKDRAFISDNCRRLQDEMLLFGRGGLPTPANPFDGSLRSLINCYQTDLDSPYQKNRFHTRQGRDSLLRRIAARHGEEELRDIKARVLLAWHKEWSGDETKLATGAAIIGQLRALFSFGATLLEDPDCERLCGVMHKMRFKGSKARQVSITADHANALRAKARSWFGLYSIALGQALQFEGTLRQKDVIGEWVPLREPGVSAVFWKGQKWLRGIVWQEIDDHLVLKHVTSKKQKEVVIDLKLAPMVLEELALMAKTTPAMLTRDMLPATGPIITNEINAMPWSSNEYRRKWRKVADLVGIPKSIKNMDSRSGAISEGIMAGASLEMVRHAATHSDISQTADYDRNQAQATATVMKLRVENRNKPKTD